MAEITVIMPAYNAARFIEDSIKSVLGQTFTDFQLIILNDCSTDNTEEIIERFAQTDSRIVYYKNECNSGAAKTRNVGISMAESKWIAFLDSDDLWKNDKLEKHFDFIKTHPDAQLTYTASSFISDSGEPYGYVMTVPEKIDYKTLLRKNLISCSSAIVDTKLMQSVKMANDSMHEDYTAWLTILRKIKFAYGINEPLLLYRLSANSKSSNRLKSAKMLFNSYRYVGYNTAVAGVFTFRYMFHSLSKRRHIRSNG